MWQGPEGLAEFLDGRKGFVDEQHDVDEVLGQQDRPDGSAEVRTRLHFHLRDPGTGEIFTGIAFHTWELRRQRAGDVRVAAQLVNGFADLNDAATRLFGHPDEGLSR